MYARMRRRATDGSDERWAQRFLDALRAGSVRSATEVVEAAMDQGLDGAAVHARLIAPAIRRIGDLWENGSISIADEHLATAISGA